MTFTLSTYLFYVCIGKILWFGGVPRISDLCNTLKYLPPISNYFGYYSCTAYRRVVYRHFFNLVWVTMYSLHLVLILSSTHMLHFNMLRVTLIWLERYTHICHKICICPISCHDNWNSRLLKTFSLHNTIISLKEVSVLSQNSKRFEELNL